MIRALVALAGMAIAAAQSGYAPAGECAACHRQIRESYRQTGMGRSFYAPAAANTIEDYTGKNTYYHAASDSYFSMLRRGGSYYQRRYQLDGSGAQVNVMEKRIDYVLGSGNHARAYLYRTGRGTLVELPLAWYSEKGGYWAMNPGYDRPHHDGFRRPITYDCMFCHNAYPQIPAAGEQPFAEPVYTGALPEGIDCQRCHGPGARHVELARRGGRLEEVRSAIMNPKRLSARRQMEICMACHLETTSFPLPNALERYERGPFSYRPGEPLEAFLLNFDHAPGKGREEKFELVSAAYRLRRSACFVQSKGALVCTTCHDPHQAPRGEAAARHYNAVCRQCHASAFERSVASGKHTRAGGCIDCHMPQRRTEDVVHAAATDHYIQRRRPAGDLLAERAERHETEAGAYRGPVVLYYPETLPRTAENELDLAVAQVNQKSNLEQGIAQLAAAIEKYSPARAEYYFELAEARREKGDLAKAAVEYREALRRNPAFVPAMRKLGAALRRTGDLRQSAEWLEKARMARPDDPQAWYETGLTYRAQSRMAEAAGALEKAIALDPDMPEAHNNLGVMRAAAGEQARAAAAFREAIRIQPDYADAHGNLANLLAASGDLAAALREFEAALRLGPDDAATRYNYAMTLGRARRFDDAQRQLEEALRLDANLADAHQLLAGLLMAKGQAQTAIAHYREALRIQPANGKAHLGLGAALLAAGDRAGAVEHFQKAAADGDPAVSGQAAQILQSLGGR